jgi:hypothetical protein
VVVGAVVVVVVVSLSEYLCEDKYLKSMNGVRNKDRGVVG